jgi:hypothetical protein
MKAIKKWHSRFSNFLSATSRISETSKEDPMSSEKWKRVPTIKDYQNFESELSDGTLKNFVKFRRLLMAIPEDRSMNLPTLETTKTFRDISNYLDTLHPLEQGYLMILAMRYFEEDEEMSNEINPNYLRMKYLLIPKLPKSERAKYIDDIENKEYKNILLNSPEPDNKTEQQTDLTNPQKSQSEKNSSCGFITAFIVILFILAIIGIIFVQKIFHDESKL